MAEATGSRILVVDDSIDSAETLGELLKIWGHDVRLAHDGEAGLGQRLHLLRRHVLRCHDDGYALADLAPDAFVVCADGLSGYGR